MAVFELDISMRNYGKEDPSSFVTRSEYITNIFTRAEEEATADAPSFVRGRVYSYDLKVIKKITGYTPVEYARLYAKKPGLFYARFIVPNPDAVDVIYE